MKCEQQRVSWRPVPREFEASPTVSPCKALTLWERSCMQEHGGKYPRLQKMPDPFSSDPDYVDFWVST